MAQQFQTNKHDLSNTQIVDYTESQLEAGEVRCAIQHFAFTANNITYGVVGEKIRYWEFFPARHSDNTDWGVLPVWGFAEVVESKSSEIGLGERLFGYFPPATTLTIKPDRVTARSLIDASVHRTSLPPAYNLYRRINNEPNESRDFEEERMLLSPLYLTAFCIHDMFSEKTWFGAQQVIVVSASSKTSIGTAYAIAEDSSAPTLIGLTSPRNLEFVNGLGIYKHVLSYQDIAKIDAGKPTMIIDMSANGEILGTLHKHLGNNMVFCSNVGITHWDDAGMGPDFIAERSQQFFAPSHILKRIKEWGGNVFDEQSTQFVMRTAAKSRAWLKIHPVMGLSGLNSVYPDVLHGNAAPSEGIVVAL